MPIIHSIPMKDLTEDDVRAGFTAPLWKCTQPRPVPPNDRNHRTDAQGESK